MVAIARIACLLILGALWGVFVLTASSGGFEGGRGSGSLLVLLALIGIGFLIVDVAAVRHGQDWPRTRINAGTYQVMAVVPSADSTSLQLLIRFRRKDADDWDCLYSFPVAAFESGCEDGNRLTVVEANGFKRLKLWKDTEAS